MKVIIIGGGIGGLCAAIGLGRVGVEAAVFEQADQLREVGAGLTLWVNATKALEKLGAANGLLAIGSALARFEVRSWRGDLLGVTPIALLERKLGTPLSVIVHRGEFLDQLSRLLDPKRLHCGSRCVSFNADDAGVTVGFANGREDRGDILVGADGLHSVIRARLHGQSKPRYAGYTCWRGVARFDHKALPLGLGFEAWGRGKRFAALPCGRGRFIWYGTKNAPEGMAEAPGGRKAEALACFGDWFSPIPEVIEAAEEGILRNDIVDRKPFSTWGRGRVTLLGDAAHPTTPNFGQGACLAIEDAVTLARCFGQSGPAEALLRSYESRRIPRTTAITNQSWRMGVMGQWENPLACKLRDMISRLTPTAISARFMESILRHDPPDLP